MSNLLSITSVFTYIGYIVLAIIVLLFMVLIHELGHYTAGKILKFKINEFSVGFGPKLIQKKKKKWRENYPKSTAIGWILCF